MSRCESSPNAPPKGPLSGFRVLEFQSLGAAPFAAMLLADMGADVIVVDRPTTAAGSQDVDINFLRRSRRSIILNLKSKNDVESALALIQHADVLIEGYRPGVMERLGLGPSASFKQNPRLIYGRMTGWGQNGPLAPLAGHDINYIALTGVLDAIGQAGGTPVLPLNLVGDFGGGGMLLAFGILSALLEAQRSGVGQVVDAAMIDGSSLLATMFHGLVAAGRWSVERGTNLLDGGAPWYSTYETKDQHHMAVGAIEPHFYATFVAKLGLDIKSLPDRTDQGNWPALRQRFAAVFKTRSRSEWENHFNDADACVTPVLSFTEAHTHAHSVARTAFTRMGNFKVPTPAPRFSRTPAGPPREPPSAGSGGKTALRDWGLSEADIDRFETY